MPSSISQLHSYLNWRNDKHIKVWNGIFILNIFCQFFIDVFALCNLSRQKSKFQNSTLFFSEHFKETFLEAIQANAYLSGSVYSSPQSNPDRQLDDLEESNLCAVQTAPCF